MKETFCSNNSNTVQGFKDIFQKVKARILAPPLGDPKAGPGPDAEHNFAYYVLGCTTVIKKLVYNNAVHNCLEIPAAASD